MSEDITKEEIIAFGKKIIKSRKVQAIGGGTAIGGYLGSSIGIAALGGAISGLLPLAAIGAYVGYKIEKKISEKKLQKEDSTPKE